MMKSKKGMAKQKNDYSPPSQQALEVKAPKALIPLMQAFHVDSEDAANALIAESAKAIYGDSLCMSVTISRKELKAISSLMRGINPIDILETLYAAQIVVSHMLGMRKLAESFSSDQKLGLDLLKFSSESIQQLSKKRTGCQQNITVNYNYSGQGNALMQAVIPLHGDEHANQRS